MLPPNASSAVAPWRVVTVLEVIGDDAHCQDSTGIMLIVPVGYRRAKGAVPAAGERWVLDRAIMGSWTFAAILEGDPPSVEGSRASGAALNSLLNTLADMGLIVNDTSP